MAETSAEINKLSQMLANGHTKGRDAVILTTMFHKLLQLSCTVPSNYKAILAVEPHLTVQVGLPLACLLIV